MNVQVIPQLFTNQFRVPHKTCLMITGICKFDLTFLSIMMFGKSRRYVYLECTDKTNKPTCLAAVDQKIMASRKMTDVSRLLDSSFNSVGRSAECLPAANNGCNTACPT